MLQWLKRFLLITPKEGSKEVPEESSEKVPKWAYLLPILFAFFGGVIAWLGFRNRDGAEWLFYTGVIATVVWVVLVVLIVMS